MKSRVLLFVAANVIVVGCAVGPGYHRPDVAPPAAYRPPSPLEDSLKPTFDSLAASRDSMNRGGPGSATNMPAAGSTVNPSYRLSDSAANISWFDLFQDTVLTGLVTTAINENRDVRTAVAVIEEYRAEVGVASGALFPQLSASGASGREKQTFGSTFHIPAFNTLQAQANLSWELDFWGRIRQTQSAARNDYLAKEDSRRSVVIDLVSTVAVAYMRLRELDLDLDISRRTLASRQQTYSLARQRFDRGLISELDVRQFEANVADPAAQVANYERQVHQQEDTISMLLGRHPGAIPRGRELTDILKQVDVPVGAPSVLLERRPDIREAEHMLVAANARVGAAFDARLPKFTITGTWGAQAFDSSRYIPQGTFGAINNQAYQILAGVSIPIFTGGSLKSEENASSARKRQAEYHYQQTVLNATREVDAALVEVRTDRDQVVAQQTQVNALRRALQLANDRYAAGVSSYLDVLDAERSLFTAELSLTAAERQGLVGVVTLYRALGGGWPVAGYHLEGK